VGELDFGVLKMWNPFLAIEKFLDHNIETGNIWYYIIGLVALVLYFIIF
jgi:hypothetical protein